MQKRRLGRTELSISCIGCGGIPIRDLAVNMALKVVRKAFDMGINYFDTAPTYGDSEEKIGLALKDVRDKCVFTTKTVSRTKRDSLNDVENSLRRFKTDRLDVIQLHGIDDLKTLDKAMKSDGSLKTCKEARSKGLVDFVGISGHIPRVLVKAIGTNEFDVVTVPLNIVTRQASEELLSRAKELDVGVTTIKPFLTKITTLSTTNYRPSLSILSENPDLADFLGHTTNDKARSALRYVLAQDVSAVVPGLRSLREVDVAAKAGKEFNGLTEEEKRRFKVHLKYEYCRDCGLCRPCPENLNIIAILRFHSLIFDYDLKDWGKKLYDGLEVKAESCTKCGECEPRCPYNIQIIDLIQEMQSPMS